MNSRAYSLANGILLLLLAVSCLVVNLPERTQEWIRTTLRDAASPLLQMVDQTFAPGLYVSDSGLSDHQFERAQQQWTLEKDRLIRQIAVLRQQQGSQQQSELTAECSVNLFQPRLVSARIMLDQQEQNWRQGNLILSGRSSEINEHDWVIKSELPLLDIGEDYQLSADQIVLAGRSIIGQVDQVGRWSSSYRPVTDAKFRCPATIMNRQTGRIQYESAGSLHGTGEAECELQYLENTVPVSPGDLVVLADTERRFEVPLILGVVDAAEIIESSPFWIIRVVPAVQSGDRRQVQILTERLNPTRLTSLSVTPETKRE